jgi:predicted ester cyclase
MTPNVAENKRIARRFPEEVATEGEIELIDEICTEDVVEHSPLGERRGREALKEQSEYIHAAFPDVAVTIEDAVAEGDTIAQRLAFHGTHEGEFMGIEPTGTEVEIVNMLFTRIEDGQIAERWLLPDTLGLLQQLGVVEPPGE